MTTIQQKKALVLLEPDTEEDADCVELFDEDRYCYGIRNIAYKRDGMIYWRRQPLTPEDVLHPKWEDHILQGENHYTICHYLYMVLRLVYRGITSVVVLHDTPVSWGIPGVGGYHVPDVVVLKGVHMRKLRGVYTLRSTGGHAILAIEVTSKSTRHVDMPSKKWTETKFKHYAKVGVRIYVIIDEYARILGYPPPIYVYILMENGKYAKVAPNAEGRFWLETVNLWLGTEGERVMLFAQDGTPFRDHEDVVEAYQQESEKRKRAEERIWKLARRLLAIMDDEEISAETGLAPEEVQALRSEQSETTT